MVNPRRIGAILVPVALMFAAACGGSGSSDTAGGTESAAPSVSASASPSTNGIDQLGVREILDRAEAASVEAGSVRIHGSFTEDEEPIALDLRVEEASTATGFITVSGTRIDLIRQDSTLYIKANRKFWRSIGGNEAADLMSGKWLKTNEKNKNFKDLGNFTRLPKLFDELLEPEGEPTKAGTETINGVPAVVLRDGSDSNLYIAAQGEPYVLRVSNNDDDHIDFDDYGEPVEVEIPPADQVIDVNKLRR